MRTIRRTADERAVAPIIAEILLVAITVGIAGVVYFTANNLTMQSSSPSHPFVAFAPVQTQDGVATISIISVSRAVSPGTYGVNLEAGGVFGKPTALPRSDIPADVLVGGEAYRIAWHDVGGAGVVTGGDPITITAATGSFAPGTTYTFFLIWTDGSVAQSATWTG